MTRKPAAAGNQERRAYHREPQSALAADAVPPGTKVLAYTTFPAPYRVELFEVLASRFQVRAVYERSTDSAHERATAWYSRVSDGTSIIVSDRAGRTAYRRLLRSIRTFDAVLLYEYSSLSAMRLMRRCQRLKVPYLINADGGFISHTTVKTKIKRLFIRRAAGCLAGSESAVRYFCEYGADPSKIYRHDFTNLSSTDMQSQMVSEKKKQTLRRRLGLEADATIAICVGRFSEQKGISVLLNAWTRLNTSATLLLVGGGEQEAAYLRFIQSNGLESVLIRGFAPKTELFDYYLASDLFVLPTRKDVWGLVINEAMACGLPVITTERCVAGVELIEPGVNGFIVPVDDSAALRDALVELCSDEALRLRMGSANLTKIAGSTIENMAAAQMHAIEEVVGP